MCKKKDSLKDSQKSIKNLKSYADTLHDASFLFEEKVEELSLLRRIGNIVGYLFDQEVFYRKFVDILMEETNIENCSFMLMDNDSNRLVLKMARGRNDDGTFFEHPIDSGTIFSMGEGVAGKVASERETILVDDASKDKRFEIRKTRFSIGSLLCTPLIFQEKVLGVINLSHSQPHAFNQTNKRIIELLCAFVSSMLGNAIDYITIKDQEKLKAILEGIRLSILLIDPETSKIVDCNRYTEEWLGYSKEELLSKKHIFDILSPEYQERAKQIVHEIIEKNSPEFYEICVIKKDGNANIGEINGTMISYQGKNIVQLSIRDITERRNFEKALKKSEEKYHNLLETASDAIISTNQDGIIINFNKRAEEIFGYTREKVLGKPVLLLSPEEDRERERKALEKFKTSRQLGIIGKTIEREGLRKDGQRIPLESSWSILKIEGDYIITAILRDITERKKAERELRETKEFIEKVIKTSVDGIMTCDINGNVTSVNSSLEKMTGLKKEEILGEHASILISEDQKIRKMFRDKTAQLFEMGSTSYESALKRKDSKYVEVDVNSFLIKNEKGDYIAGVSIFRDITERKKAAMEIRKAKEFLENLFKTSTDAILVTDPQGNITVVNDTMEKMVGYSKDELLGKHSSILNPPDKELRSRIVRDLKKLFEEGSIYGHETTWQRKDGQHIFIESNKSLLKDKDGHVIGGVNFARDVTEKKKVESMLLQTEKLKSLGELAGGVAHDFNNVLAAILGRVQLLRMHFKTPPGIQEKRKSMLELRKSLEVIEHAAIDGAETVRRIQEFSRRNSNDKCFTQVDINKLIVDALEFTKVRWKNEAESKGIRIQFKKELSTLPSVVGCASELREVFTNLINNAIDAMPQGGQIKVKTFKEDDYISVKLEDAGSGIPKAIKDRIFDPFFTTKGVKSTGLGLSVSYGIINRHQGNITVDSMEGKGAIFTINLPIFEKTKKKEKAQSISDELKKAEILVIEDEEDVRKLLSDILTDGGHEVEASSNGREGVEIFTKGEFDLVFTDLGMPDMSGWQVAQEIKKVKNSTPVALITGWNIQLKDSELKKRGVDLVINKPFRVDHVLGLVQEVMKPREKTKKKVKITKEVRKKKTSMQRIRNKGYS